MEFNRISMRFTLANATIYILMKAIDTHKEDEKYMSCVWLDALQRVAH